VQHYWVPLQGALQENVIAYEYKIMLIINTTATD